MTLARFTLPALILFCTSSTFAYQAQEGNITASFGPYFSRTDFDNTNSGASSPYKRGWGLVLNGDVSDKGALEFSIFQIQKTYLRDADAKFISEKSELIQIALGYRYWLHELFSASCTLATAYSIGTPTIEYSDFAPGSEVTTSARDTTEYGLDLAAQVELWSFNSFDLIGEGRYFHSLTRKTGERANHYGGMIGLRYLVQTKN